MVVGCCWLSLMASNIQLVHFFIQTIKKMNLYIEMSFNKLVSFLIGKGAVISKQQLIDSLDGELDLVRTMYLRARIKADDELLHAAIILGSDDVVDFIFHERIKSHFSYQEFVNMYMCKIENGKDVPANIESLLMDSQFNYASLVMLNLGHLQVDIEMRHLQCYVERMQQRPANAKFTPEIDKRKILQALCRHDLYDLYWKYQEYFEPELYDIGTFMSIKNSKNTSFINEIYRRCAENIAACVDLHFVHHLRFGELCERRKRLERRRLWSGEPGIADPTMSVIYRPTMDAVVYL
jgi:hypothetical protein